MVLNEKTVAVDTDFINHIADTRMNIDDIIENIKKLLEHFDVVAVIHPLVYQHEIDTSNTRLAKMFSEEVVHILELSDIFTGDPGERQYYIYLVREFYNSLRGESLSFSDDQIFTSWIRMRSLGEIHSVSMCLICGTGVFLSDDGDSKKLKTIVQQRQLGEIYVYNREEMKDEYRNTGGSSVSRKVLHKLTHEA